MDLTGEELTKRTKQNYRNIISFPRLSPMVFEALRSRLKQSESTLSVEVERIYMPPLKKKSPFIPILSFKYKLEGATPYASLRIEMLHSIEEDKKTKFKGLGLRFEVGDPEHNYYHIQMFKPSVCLDLLPETDPCIPATAHCPVSLVVCLIISFYGIHAWSKFFSDLPIKKRHKASMMQILK